MKTNLNQVDRGVRIFLSILIVDLFIMDMISGFAGILLLILAAGLLVTSFIGFCPVYNFFGLSTKRKALPKKDIS